jgi:hypothetical protein
LDRFGDLPHRCRSLAPGGGHQIIRPLVIRPTAENILLILGSAGIAIGFAFKDYVSSLIAGVVIIYDRPYRTGTG